MSAAENSSGESAALGIGGRISGAAGATPGYENMAETGGSGVQAANPGGAADAGAASAGKGPRPGAHDVTAADRDSAPEGAGSAVTATVRGAHDTRSRQAGAGETGLGEPETGGNQSEADLAPPRPD